MNGSLPENTAELRALYRLAEARSARLRLLFDSARHLAMADDDGVEHQMRLASERVAHFLGFTSGRLLPDLPAGSEPDNQLLELAISPGSLPCAYILLDGGSGGNHQADDLEAVLVLRQLMAARLVALHRERERERLLLELADREMRLAALVERMIADDESARRRLSADLHDSVAQVAGAALRRLEIVDDVRSELPEHVACELDRGLELVRQTVRELRGLIQGLRPVTLESLGLGAALHEELPRLVDVPVRVVSNAEGGQRPEPEVEMALFRSAQEAVHNVRKHACGCTQVEVSLEIATDRLSLEIANDGECVDPLLLESRRSGASGEGLGLLMMRERIAAIGGTTKIEPLETGGLRIAIEVLRTSVLGKCS